MLGVPSPRSPPPTLVALRISAFGDVPVLHIRQPGSLTTAILSEDTLSTYNDHFTSYSIYSEGEYKIEQNELK